ncbi:MAG TPA: bifunctional glutamate N-acetyltransferase/amino-acid acetyltransferase ArgJ [Candidatus Krumholzibacteria bacterium]|nr:bifunctional glutamate N-acetyltransferase/amino-acid acetyltransferase ArgJ [Candidatus Krumholzibacteria bacterium]
MAEAVTVEHSHATAAITAAAGFRAAGVHAGIRKKRLDVALVVSDRAAAAAAVFTRNLAVAAPVIVSREHLQLSGGRARAIVVNAGNANACTGEPGLVAARRTTLAVADLLGVPVEQVLVASTGVIGQPLPLPRLLGALPRAVRGLTRAGGADAASAILTTDLREKECVRSVDTASGTYIVGGMAKGSGMIHPDMATTLAFVTTDAAVSPQLLQDCLRQATDASFNRISVDGDTSTNDTIAVLANGASGVEVDAQRPESVAAFAGALTEVLIELGKMVVRDGEGATKLIEIRVRGASDEAMALQVARTVAGSPLVKTAVHGADANWGRVVAAACRAHVPLVPEKLGVDFGDVAVVRPGFVSRFSAAAARRALERDEVTITIDLGLGNATATTWTCDLSAGYVHINASYRS